MKPIEKTSDYGGRDTHGLRRDKETAALEVLKSTGIDVLEAALMAKEALARGRGRVKRALPVFASTCWMHVACYAEVSG